MLSGYELAARWAVGADRWNGFVAAHPRGWWWHSTHWIDYCLAYRSDAEDLSFAVLERATGGKVVAVVPLVKEADHVAMGGNPCAGPLVCRAHAPVAADIYALIGESAKLHDVRRVRLRQMPRQPDWPCAMRPDWRDTSWQTYVLPLAADTRDLWRNLRASYRPLIKRAHREREVMVTGQPWAAEACHVLHRQSAGRETRPQATWDLMARWLELGDAVVALVSRRREELHRGDPLPWSGFAYVIRWRDWAYYASGATLELNTAASLQWPLIEALRGWGTRYYELGWAARPGEGEKEQGIAMFKSGFGGELWTIPASERSY